MNNQEQQLDQQAAPETTRGWFWDWKIIVVIVILIAVAVYYFGFYKKSAGEIAPKEGDSMVVPADKAKQAEENRETMQNKKITVPKDDDKDYLSEEQEGISGTSTEKADTDGDGLSDGYEVRINRTDPLKVDTDDDGLNDYEEIYIYSTKPLNPDTDSDGLKDGEEDKYGTDLLNPDTDGDGYLDGEEVEHGYNPAGEGKLEDRI